MRFRGVSLNIAPTLVIAMMLGCMIANLIQLPYLANYTINSRWTEERMTYDPEVKDGKALTYNDHDEKHHREEDVEVAQKVRVLCWVLTSPDRHQSKAVHVKVTWGKRCNKLIFMSSADDASIGSVNLGHYEKNPTSWDKTKAALNYLYDNHLDDYDWFFRGDDTTFVIMENMRYMLSTYDPDHPIYLGSRIRRFIPQGYMSGDAGCVLSREAVRQVVEVGLPDATKCTSDSRGIEDVELGKCLVNVGVTFDDSRDSMGRPRFFQLSPKRHISGSVPTWYRDFAYYKHDQGLGCCSDTAITFHSITPREMYEMNYLVYHLKPYGITHRDPFPAPLPPDINSSSTQLLKNKPKT